MTKRQKHNATREPVAFVYDCSKCSKMVVVPADSPIKCPKCGSQDMVFVGNRYAKKPAKVAGPVETRALLAAVYVREDSHLTHSLDVTADKFLCRGPKPSSAADEMADDVNAKPTCPKCAARDPRFN